MGKGLFGRVQGELSAREKSPGLLMSDILTLPDDIGKLLNWMIRKGDAKLEEMTRVTGKNEAETKKILADLIDKGYVREMDVRGETLYRIRLAPKRGRDIPLDLWKAIDDKVDKK